MVIIENISETTEFLKNQIKNGKSIGFVPTMGALHQGHIALVEKAKLENDIVVCSIFVNPTQFNNPEDLKKYPRTLEEDCKMLQVAGCDLVFAPSAEEMYEETPVLKIDFGYLEQILEGKFRPGHFNGVGIVVSKLFNIVKPTKAYFGQKDLQQVAVVKRLVKDLSFDLELIVCDTIRESDGLAMSSRNRRLSSSAREVAPKIFESLLIGQKYLFEGLNVEETKQKVVEWYENSPEFTLEYYEIVEADTLNPIEKKHEGQKTAIVIAAFLDGVRLIDNIVF
jgi:pantoate--beta-alanine ligase